jgi:hypothetical protein
VLFREAQADGAGQQLSLGKQRQFDAMVGAARATRETEVHFMVEEMDGIRLWKNGGIGVADHPSFIYNRTSYPLIEQESKFGDVAQCV